MPTRAAYFAYLVNQKNGAENDDRSLGTFEPRFHKLIHPCTRASRLILEWIFIPTELIKILGY